MQNILRKKICIISSKFIYQLSCPSLWNQTYYLTTLRLWIAFVSIERHGYRESFHFSRCHYRSKVSKAENVQELHMTVQVQPHTCINHHLFGSIHLFMVPQVTKRSLERVPWIGDWREAAATKSMEKTLQPPLIHSILLVWPQLWTCT